MNDFIGKSVKNKNNTQNSCIVYLVSDLSGTTAAAILNALASHFPNFSFEERNFPRCNSEEKIEEILKEITKDTSIGKAVLVLCSIFDKNLEEKLSTESKKKQALCIPIISYTLGKVGKYLKTSPSTRGGRIMNSRYFSKIEALEYAMATDDGRNIRMIDKADIIVSGASRTSKSPTCIYLAYRGYKAANIPFIADHNILERIKFKQNQLKIGLTINAERLADIRSHRMKTMMKDYTNKNVEDSYTGLSKINDELKEARIFFERNNWIIIDITNLSVEETAAAIIEEFERNKCK